MKYCPKCQANVEGLIYRCDCCGALLKPEKRFFTCGIYELPQCLYFSSLTYEMMEALQPKNPEQYDTFLEQVGISMVCYPEWMLIDGKIKDRLSYSPKKKYASMTITVDYDQFVAADYEEKADLIAAALLKSIHLLQERLRKYKLSIEDIVMQADAVLSRYTLSAKK